MHLIRRYALAITVKPTVGAPHPSCATGLLQRAVALVVALISIGAGAPALVPSIALPSPVNVAADEVTVTLATAPDQPARRNLARRRRRLSWTARAVLPPRFLQPALAWFASWSWRWEPTLRRQRRGPPSLAF